MYMLGYIINKKVYQKNFKTARAMLDFIIKIYEKNIKNSENSDDTIILQYEQKTVPASNYKYLEAINIEYILKKVALEKYYKTKKVKKDETPF